MKEVRYEKHSEKEKREKRRRWWYITMTPFVKFEDYENADMFSLHYKG